MRISDWSSDVCSSDVTILVARCRSPSPHVRLPITGCAGATARGAVPRGLRGLVALGSSKHCLPGLLSVEADSASTSPADCGRSEEHTSDLQSLMRTSYAVFCLKKKHEKRMTQ